MTQQPRHRAACEKAGSKWRVAELKCVLYWCLVSHDAAWMLAKVKPPELNMSHRSGLFIHSQLAAKTIQALPAFTLGEGVQVLECHTPAEADKHLALFDGDRWLAWDMEWKFDRPTQKAGRIALFQIGNEQVVVLIRVVDMIALPAKLVAILTDPEILKLGVNIHDAKKLYADFNIDPVALFELSRGAWVVNTEFWKDDENRNPLHRISLQHLVAKYLNCYLPKDQQASNWEAELTQEQRDYAAKDALASLRVFEALRALGTNNLKYDIAEHAGCRVTRTESESEAWSIAFSPVKGWKTANSGEASGSTKSPVAPRRKTALSKLPSNYDIDGSASGSSKPKLPDSDGTKAVGPEDSTKPGVGLRGRKRPIDAAVDADVEPMAKKARRG
ncbi:ribonuclease H-like protein [Exidia glandulosa HHB12029]|uniref:Ribonuclease H-like protein n=1 Tax=Exidia glandulosa HHB12029 TaxID=1314781 RepID=A0A165FTB4_EXIGL|nr:ribonuclease H-like protein [Exidia glandulosa HHB12029]